MIDPPRQDWEAYDAAIQAEHARWVRSLSSAERWTIYSDMFDTVWKQRSEVPTSAGYELWRWNEKLRLRRKLVDAFTRLDQYRGPATSNDAP